MDENVRRQAEVNKVEAHSAVPTDVISTCLPRCPRAFRAGSKLDPQYAVGFLEHSEVEFRWEALTFGRNTRGAPLADSNSIRTESSVAIRPDPDVPAAPMASKTTVHNGYRLITRPSREKGAGLKILASVSPSAAAPLRPEGPPGDPTVGLPAGRSVVSKLLESRTSTVAPTIQSGPPI